MRSAWTKAIRVAVAGLLLAGNLPGMAWAVELEILGDMTSPHGGFGVYQNLLKDSEKLDDTGVWTVTNTVTPVADQTPTAPDGSTTADKLTFGGAGTVDSLAQDSGVASTAAAYTFSIWLRGVSGGTTIILKIEDANENNTTVVTGLSATKWERYSVTQTFASAGGNIVVTVLEQAAADAPVVLAWGAQLEKSNKPNVYARTVGTAVSTQSFGLALGKDLHVGGVMEVGSSLTSGADGQDGQLKIYSEQGATDYTVTINPNAAMTQSVVYTLPVDDGTDGQVLKTNGTGALTWTNPTDLGASFSGLTTGTNTTATMTVGSGASLVIAGTLDLQTAISNTTVSNGGAVQVSDAFTVTGASILNGGLTMDTDKFTVADTTGNTAIGGTLDVTGAAVLNGGLTMDTNKFTVADTTGNTSIGGTLGVTGAATLSNTLAVTGNVTVNTDKFSVTAASGNTAIAGTLSAGATSVAGDVSVRSGDKAIMDSADAGGTANDTYVMHDNANDRLRLFVDGVEVARFKK